LISSLEPRQYRRRTVALLVARRQSREPQRTYLAVADVGFEDDEGRDHRSQPPLSGVSVSHTQ